MLSNQIIQNSIDELKNITKVELAVYDLEGEKVAVTSSDAEIDTQIIRIFVTNLGLLCIWQTSISP